MDAVLIDAPCSGLGVVVDKPDIKYHVTPDSIAELAEQQKKILDTCCQYVKPGGTLVYSTCTVMPEENEKQIEAFLAAHPDFTLSDSLPGLPESLAPFAKGGMIQTFAHETGGEGYFIARMVRRP